ncbi:uncharacterized protein [Primulina huaijiensis]|uniref:uncharacterized protein isoform X2 n=1 Tax=Primulina huaijiensis TaxID=1492673 RepID=UPI003CC76E85
MPLLLISPPPPPPPFCHPTPKTSPNLPSFNISAFSTKPVSLNSVHNYGFQFLSHVRSSKTTADMDEAEEERADFTKLRQKMVSHGVKIDSCTPGLYDLLVCPKINTTGRHGSLLKFFVWSSLDLVIPWCCLKTQIFFSRCCAKVDDLCREVCPFMLAKIGTLPSKFFEVVANTKKSNPCGNLHGKINSNSPSTREGLRLEVLGEEKIIAFTYRQNGLLVGWKYRTIEKSFGRTD